MTTNKPLRITLVGKNTDNYAVVVKSTAKDATGRTVEMLTYADLQDMETKENIGGSPPSELAVADLTGLFVSDGEVTSRYLQDRVTQEAAPVILVTDLETFLFDLGPLVTLSRTDYQSISDKVREVLS